MPESIDLEKLEARVHTLESHMLRVERRLHLDAPAIIIDALPATPPPSPPIAGPTSFAPPIIAPPAVVPTVTAKTENAPVVPVTQTASVPVSVPASVLQNSAPAPDFAAPKPPPLPINTPAKPASSLLDWEQLIGGKWALWAGLLSVFGAIASFLAYTWRYFSPEAKVALGLFLGIAFLVAGEWTRKRAERWFSEGVSGAGLGFCFLSLWAGGAHFSIFGFGLTFGAMALVCALGVWLAVRYDALGLNILSVIGGFATPMLLQGNGGASGQNTAISLLVYVAILNAGVLGVSLFKRWRASVWLSFGATLTLLYFWLPNSNIDAMRLTVWTFFSFYFALYVGAACFYSLARREETAPEDIGLIVVATTIYAPFAHDLLLPIAGHFPGAFLCCFAIFWGALCALTARLAPKNALLRDVAGALGLLAFTVAIPIQVSQPWLGIALVGESAVLAWLTLRSQSELLRRAGQIVWVVALFPLAAGLIAPAGTLRFGLYAGSWPMLFGIAVTAWLAWSAHCQSLKKDANKTDELVDYYVGVAVTGSAWLLTRELLAREFALESAIMAVGFLAVAVFILGAKTRFFAVQICALVLAACVGASAILFDSSHSVPALLPVGNARFVALIGTAGALYLLTWLVRQERNETLRRAGEIIWALASLPLFQGLLSSAGAAQWGLHRGGWPGLFAVAIAAVLAWSAHRQTKNADELRNVYAGTAVAGGAWLLARETVAWTRDLNGVWMALSLCAVAVFAVGATARFTVLRASAGVLAAGAVAAALWWTWANQAPELTPFWNARFAAMIVTLGALTAIYQIARTVDYPLHATEKDAARALPLGVATLGLAAFSSEIYFGFAHFAPPHWASRAFFSLSIGWSLAALGALSVGLQARDANWRVWAYLVGGAALASLPLNALAGNLDGIPFLNLRFAAFAVAIAASCAAAWLLHKGQLAGAISEAETETIGAAASAALVLALFSLTQETWEVGRTLAPRGDDWQRGAQMAISLVWSLFGALLLAGGVQFRVQGARLGALVLLALTVCKVFLFDLSFLDGAGRALSLGGLGMALIFISWLYGRFGRSSVV